MPHLFFRTKFDFFSVLGPNKHLTYQITACGNKCPHSSNHALVLNVKWHGNNKYCFTSDTQLNTIPTQLALWNDFSTSSYVVPTSHWHPEICTRVAVIQLPLLQNILLGAIFSWQLNEPGICGRPGPAHDFCLFQNSLFLEDKFSTKTQCVWCVCRLNVKFGAIKFRI